MSIRRNHPAAVQQSADTELLCFPPLLQTILQSHITIQLQTISDFIGRIVDVTPPTLPDSDKAISTSALTTVLIDLKAQLVVQVL